MRTKTIYRKAADLLVKFGWCRWVLEDHDGKMCLYGAINKVVNGEPFIVTDESTEALNKLRPFLKSRRDPVSWNNMQSRRRADVVRLLRSAAR